jgi:hypothetical protein
MVAFAALPTELQRHTNLETCVRPARIPCPEPFGALLVQAFDSLKIEPVRSLTNGFNILVLRVKVAPESWWERRSRPLASSIQDHSAEALPHFTNACFPFCESTPQECLCQYYNSVRTKNCGIRTLQQFEAYEYSYVLQL